MTQWRAGSPHGGCNDLVHFCCLQNQCQAQEYGMPGPPPPGGSLLFQFHLPWLYALSGVLSQFSPHLFPNTPCLHASKPCHRGSSHDFKCSSVPQRLNQTDELLHALQTLLNVTSRAKSFPYCPGIYPGNISSTALIVLLTICFYVCLLH